MDATDELAIFHFHDGRTDRCVDPFRVRRLLSQGLEGEPLSQVIKAARSRLPGLSDNAVEKLLAAVCLAFDLQPVQPDGSGCTEKTQLRVLTEFLAYESALKKSTGNSATSSPPTAAASSGDPLPGKSLSDCGCS